jgi:hypothetical protein
MAMAPVCAGDLVALVEVHAETCGNGFLTGVEMNEPRYLASRKFDVNPFLELPNDLHRPICS